MTYDLIVIGAGAAGMNAATPAARLGLKTLLIDRTPEKLGGECLHTGCVPSKALLHVAKLVHDAKKLAPFGLHAEGALDFPKVMDYVHRVQAEIGEHENAEALRKQGLEIAFGDARFVGPNRIEAGGETYEARRFVVATGSRPRIPDAAGVENIGYLTHESLFDLRELPGKLLIAGGGPIGTEMAQAFTRLGSQVTLVEAGPRILPRDHEEAAGLVRKQLEAEGVTFHFNTRLESFPSQGTARLSSPQGEIEEPFDKVLLAIGKVVDHSALDPEKAGIRLNGGRFVLDSYLRTTNKRVYAAGDAAGQILLTHATELHGSVILQNLLSPWKKKISYDDLGWVTFTDPEVATFGLSEAELKKRGVRYRKAVQSFDEVNRASTDDYPESKLIVYLKGGRILGGTMVAPAAGELVQELILAKKYKLGIGKLLDKVYPYPTAARVNRWMAIWEYDRKVTPAIASLARFGFRYLG